MELCVIEGDGVGHDVVPSAVKVFKTILPDVIIHTADAGFEYHQAHGTPLPQETIDLAVRCRAVLFGSTNSPSYPVEGYYSPHYGATAHFEHLCQHPPHTLFAGGDGTRWGGFNRHPRKHGRFVRGR